MEGILATLASVPEREARFSASICFARGVDHYEIRRDIELGFVGYVNGRRAVAASEPHVVARILIGGRIIPRPSSVGEGRRGVSFEAAPDHAG